MASGKVVDLLDNIEFASVEVQLLHSPPHPESSATKFGSLDLPSTISVLCYDIPPLFPASSKPLTCHDRLNSQKFLIHSVVFAVSQSE